MKSPPFLQPHRFFLSLPALNRSSPLNWLLHSIQMKIAFSSSSDCQAHMDVSDKEEEETIEGGGKLGKNE